MSIDPIVQQLIDARVRAGRTQREVAAFAGVAQNTLSDAEAGKTEPRLGTLRRWAAALDLEPTLVGPGSTSPEPGPATGGAIGCWPPLLGDERNLPWPGFNPSVRVVRCGQSSAHGPHFMDHGPDQPRNCPGTSQTAWDAYQRWATEQRAAESTKDGTDGSAS